MAPRLLKWITVCLLIALTLSPESGQLLAGTDAASTILITEVRYEVGVGDQGGEWVELASLAHGSTDLSGFKIGDAATPASGEGMFRFPEGTLLWPGQVVVVARRAAEYEAQYGLLPDFELEDTVGHVADLQPHAGWARGSLALADDGDEIVLLNVQDEVVDALAYGVGGSTPNFEGPRIPLAPPGYSLERQPAYCDTDTAADWRARRDPRPGSIALDGACARLAPTSGLLPIGDIQGAADESPYLNQWVQFRGAVTGMLEDQNTRGARFYTVFVQDMPGADDGRPLTSDAIAVFLGPNRPQVEAGDLVRVSGQVQEYFGLTEIGFRGLNLAIESRGQPLPEPVDLGTLEPSLAEVNNLEWLESMRVTLDRGLVVGPTHSACGLAVLPSGQDRASEPPIFQPRGMLPLNVLSASDVDCSAWFQANRGDTLHTLIGPLTFHFGQFKIVDQLSAAGRHDQAPVSPVPPLGPVASDQWRIASLNAADAFDSSDEPDVDDVVQNPEELAVKLTKLTQAVSRTLRCPTLLALQEVENLFILEALTGRLEEECRLSYQAILLEGPDARGIDVALLARRDWAGLVDVSQLQACTSLATNLVDPTVACPPGQAPLFSRPPLQVRLSVQGETLTVVVVHFKSKREGEAETAPRRIEQAKAVSQRVQALLAENADAAIIVLGDFNDTPASTAGRTLIDEGGLVAASDLVGQQSRYSYNFGGISQLLDWILLSPMLLPTLTETGIVHANADYAWSMASELSPDGLPLRFSDHDVPYADFTWPLLPPPPTPTAISTAATPFPGLTAMPVIQDASAPVPATTATPEQMLATSEQSALAPTAATNGTQPQPAAQVGYLLLAAAAITVALAGFLLVGVLFARLRKRR